MSELKEMGSDYKRGAWEESIKLVHATMKHISTVSSGAVLLMAAFSERFGLPVDSPPASVFTAVSLVCFVAAIGFSVFAMWGWAKLPGLLSEKRLIGAPDFEAGWDLWATVGALLTFTVGWVCLLLLALFVP